MDDDARNALMAAAWQALERNEGWSGSKEDFMKFWARLEPSLEAVIHNEATRAKWGMRWEAAKDYAIAVLLSVPVILRLFLPVAALILAIRLTNQFMT